MVIIETPIFTKLISELMSDDEYKDLQEALVVRPDRGALIRNSGGVRVIYYWTNEQDQLYMLFAYPKNMQDNLTDLQLKKLKQIVERWSE